MTIALRHQGIDASLAELSCNANLRELIGLESEHNVPRKWNMSRFWKVLGSEPHRSLLREVFDSIARGLAMVVEEPGERAAGDATALNARRTGSAHGHKLDAAQGLPEATGGRKE